MKLKVGVIFGGESVEHEVSIISAVQAMKALDEDKYEIIPIYISKDKEWYTGKLLKDLDLYKDIDNLKKYAKNVVLYNYKNEFVLQNKNIFRRVVNTIDIALPIVHGTNVEDGTLQGQLELIGIPYAFSNVSASAIGQDKVFQKQILRSEGIDVVDYVWFYDFDYWTNSEVVTKDIKKLGYPVIVKPARLGSSVGIGIAHNDLELEDKIKDAIKYDNKVLVEKVINNLVEVNCAVLGNCESMETSNLEEVMSTDEFLSYRDKYMDGNKTKGMAATNRIIPARLDEKLSSSIKEMSKKAFKAIGNSGVVRIDYLIDKKNNKVYLNEINTIPGSLSFYLWDKDTKNYTKLLDEIISIAIKNYKKRTKITYSFNTNILKNGGKLGKKGKLKF